MLLYGNGIYQSLAGNGTYYSYVMPANTVTDNGDMIQIEFGFSNSGTGTGTTFNLTFGGATVFSAVDFFNPGDVGHIKGVVTRLSNVSQQFFGSVIGIRNSVLMYSTFATAAVNYSAPITIAATLTNYIGTNITTGGPFTVSLFQV